MTLLIDNRAGSKSLLSLPPLKKIAKPSDLTALSPTRTSVDCCIIGNGPDSNTNLMVGIEVKKYNDLLSSFTNGRLADIQLQHLIDSFDRKYLLTYGWRVNEDGLIECLWKPPKSHKPIWIKYKIGGKQVEGDQLEGFLITLSEVGVLHQSFDTEYNLARYIGRLHSYYTKEYDCHKSLKQSYSNQITIRKDQIEESKLTLMPRRGSRGWELRVAIARQFDGVLYDRAMALADNFSTVEEMICASKEELAEIRVKTRGGKGREMRIGKVIAEAMYRLIREE